MKLINSEYEDQLLIQLLELQHGVIGVSDLGEITSHVAWAKGFPESKEAFWNCAAFMWKRKIDSKKRELIKQEIIKFLAEDVDHNLDIGSGSYCYIPSVAFDCSKKMLDFNDTAIKKVQGDLLNTWQFEENSFNSITAIFVLNYISDLNFLLSEANRVLSEGGKFIVVISVEGVSKLHQIQEEQKRDFESWKELFGRVFELKEAFEKEKLWFFYLYKSV